MSRWYSSVATQVKFAQKQAALQAKNAKPDKKVTDFVRRIRRVLDKKSREHGGTEGTYLRECFLNWDADAPALLTVLDRVPESDPWSSELRYQPGRPDDASRTSSGITVVWNQRIPLFGSNEMTYDLLIEDVVNASTHFLQPQPPIPKSARPDETVPAGAEKVHQEGAARNCSRTSPVLTQNFSN